MSCFPARSPELRFRRQAGARVSLGAVLGMGLLVPAGLLGGEPVRRNFDVPAGNAEQTLRRFATQSGEQVLYSPDDVRGVQTLAIHGEFTALAALERMLRRTPLKARQDARTQAIAISANPTSRAPPETGRPPRTGTPQDLHLNSTDSPSMATRNFLSHFTAWLFATGAVFGQTAPTGPSAASDATLVLSPFEVRTDRETGYVATNTLAGTRFNTELKDVPASISVLTADFLRDIGAMNLNEALEYTIGAEQNQDSPTGNDRQGGDLQLRMRGFVNSTLGRNFFEVNTAQDSYNMERATFSRGPNSVLFGSGGAGGIADATTKRALTRPLTAFAFRAGLYDDYRFELDLNRPVTDKLALRVNLLNWKRQSWRDYEFMDRRSGALAATWRPFTSTSIRLDAEFGKIDELKPQGWPGFNGVEQWIRAGRPISTFPNPGATTPVLPGTTRRVVANQHYISNANTVMTLSGALRSLGPPASEISAGMAQNFTTFENEDVIPFSSNVMGPSATSNNRFHNVGVFIEQKLSEKWFIELAANQQHIDRTRTRALFWNDAMIWADVNAFLPGGAPNPYVGQLYVESNRTDRDFRDDTWNDYRITSTYDFSIPHLGRQQFAALVSRRDSYDQGHRTAEAWINNPAQPAYTNAANAIFRRTYISSADDNALGLPRGFDDPFAAPIDANGVRSGYYTSDRRNNLSRFDSAVAVLQSRFFSDHLVTTLGFRHDNLRQWGSTITRDPVTQEVTSVAGASDYGRTFGNTRTLGVVYHALPWLSLGANASNNATPQTFNAFGPGADNFNTPLGAREGKGLDLSARVTLLGGRLQGSLIYFETSEANSQRSKFGNATAGWLLWLNQGYLALRKPNASVSPNFISGEDTVDIDADGWETEWTFNASRGLRLVFNASKSTSLETNRFPRIFPFAEAIIAELRAVPGLAIDGINGITTAAALASTMENQIALDRQTENKEAFNTRDYSANIFINYRVREGRLRGLSFGLGSNIRGDRVIGYHSTTLEPYWAGSYVQYNGSVSYERPVTIGARKLNWTITLSGNNIFGDKHGLIPSIGNDVGIDRFFFETTPSVFLTNRFSF